MQKKILASLAMLTSIAQANEIFVFSPSANMSAWQIVNDGVMGGLSEGVFVKNKDGHGVFSGNVSLENNGGFTSIRYRLAEQKKIEAKTIVIRLKGDRKTYKFRVKADTNERHSYSVQFTTTGSWQTIELKLADMVPLFHGRQLNISNFNHNVIGEVGLSIANNKAENFNLVIERISLK